MRAAKLPIGVVVRLLFVALLLSRLSFPNWAEGHIAGAYRQPVRADELLESRDFGKADRKDFRGVENLFSVVPRVRGDNANAKLISLPMLLVGGSGSFYRAPSPTAMFFGRCKGIVVPTKVKARLSFVWQARFGQENRRIYRILHPVVGTLQFSEVSSIHSVNDVLGGNASNILGSEPHKECNFLSFPKIQFVETDAAVQGGIDGQPRSQVAFGDFLRMLQSFKGQINGVNGSLGSSASPIGASMSGEGSPHGREQGRCDKADPPQPYVIASIRPIGLGLCRSGVFPRDALGGLLLGLGFITGSFISFGAWRVAGRGDRRGWLLVVSGIFCAGFSIWLLS